MANRGTPPKLPGKAPKKRKKRKYSKRVDAEIAALVSFRGFLKYVQRPGSSLRDIWSSEYLSDEDGAPSLQDSCTFPQFKNIASKGQWRKRRKEHWSEIRKKVLEAASSEAIQAELNEIAVLEGVKTVVLQNITGDTAADIKAVTPKSLEGAVSAYIALDKRVSAKREVVIDGTADAAAHPMVGHPGQAALAAEVPAVPTEGDISEEEIVAMSRALARKRAGLPDLVEPTPEIPAELIEGEAEIMSGPEFKAIIEGDNSGGDSSDGEATTDDGEEPDGEASGGLLPDRSERGPSLVVA